MLNKEKYAKEIVEAAVSCGGEGLGVKDGKPLSCKNMGCDKCDLDFYGNCRTEFTEWANSEYVEPAVDWTEVAIDTPILVRDKKTGEWIKRHFAKYENKRVYAYLGGKTSWSADDTYDIADWEYAKLAEEVQEDGR